MFTVSRQLLSATSPSSYWSFPPPGLTLPLPCILAQRFAEIALSEVSITLLLATPKDLYLCSFDDYKKHRFLIFGTLFGQAKSDDLVVFLSF